MKKLLFNIVLIILLFPINLILAQSTGNDKYDEMRNAFVLGLEEKGLEICSELLSRSEYSNLREEAVFYIAEYFFIIGFGADEINNLNRAYTYYLVYENDYPNSQYSNIVNKRINTLISYYKSDIAFRNLYDFKENESVIVDRKLIFTNILFTFNFPSEYLFFSFNESEQPSSEILDRYFDEIIINHPDFEIYGYYWKIISQLATIDGPDIITDRLLDFDVDEVFIRSFTSLDQSIVAYRVPTKLSSSALILKEKLENMLKPLSEKYPHHPLTLRLHLLYTFFFMTKDDDKFDSDTKRHLEFVIKNEPDKTHYRYLLAKEFILDNKFQ